MRGLDRLLADLAQTSLERFQKNDDNSDIHSKFGKTASFLENRRNVLFMIIKAVFRKRDLQAGRVGSLSVDFWRKWKFNQKPTRNRSQPPGCFLKAAFLSTKKSIFDFSRISRNFKTGQVMIIFLQLFQWRPCKIIQRSIQPAHTDIRLGWRRNPLAVHPSRSIDEIRDRQRRQLPSLKLS